MGQFSLFNCSHSYFILCYITTIKWFCLVILSCLSWYGYGIFCRPYISLVMYFNILSKKSHKLNLKVHKFNTSHECVPSYLNNCTISNKFKKKNWLFCTKVNFVKKQLKKCPGPILRKYSHLKRLGV